MSEYKKFSKELYDENDRIAKNVAVEFLESTGFYKLETPLSEQKEEFKKQDFEIVLVPDNQKISVEVERKKVWSKTCEWQGWPTIDVPVRKNKSKARLYIMINDLCNTIAITMMKNVLKSRISPKKTIYTKNEDFFNVEKKEFKFYCKKNHGWERCENM